MRGGVVCSMINNASCDLRNVHAFILLRWPFRLPRKFMAIITTTVYILPQAGTDLELKDLYHILNNLEDVHQAATHIVVGDFNQVTLRKVLPKYFQHIDVNTRGFLTQSQLFLLPQCL